MDLHVVRYPEHDFIIFKNIYILFSVSVYDMNVMGAPAEGLLRRIS